MSLENPLPLSMSRGLGEVSSSFSSRSSFSSLTTKLETKARTVLEAVAEFELPKTSALPPSVRSSFRSLAVSTVSDSQTLVYIGTHGGKIILLSLNPSSVVAPNLDPANQTGCEASSSMKLTFLRSLSVSDCSVDSIQECVEIGKILVLSDGFLFLLDLHLLQPVRRLNFPRGATVVARRLRGIDSTSSDLLEDGVPRSELSSPGQRFLQKLGGGIRTNGTKSRDYESLRDGNCVVAVAVGKRLILIELLLPGRRDRTDRDADTGEIFIVLKEIQSVEGVKTMVWLDDSIIIGTVNGYTLFSCVTGQSAPLFSLPDTSSPPCLKPLVKDHNVLLFVDNVGIIVNAFGQPVGGSLIFRCVPDSVGEISSYVIVVKDGNVDLYHKKTSLSIQSLHFAMERVGPCIVANEESGTGEFVVFATPSKAICFRKVSAEEQIKDLLRKKNFKEAISLVEELECEGEMTKEMLSFVHAQVGFLLLFDLHFEEAVNHFLQSETMEPSEIFPFIMRDPNRWSLLVPRKRYWGLHPPPVPLENVVDDGLMAIQRAVFLRKAGVETATDEDFLLNPPSRAELLESAIQNMIRYLRVCRNKDLALQVREGVDTFLMYLYRALNHVDDMEQLASSENSCVVEELESLLDESGHLRTLAFLYASKGLSSKALAIWRILARNYSSGLWKDPATEQPNQDTGTSVISGKKTAAIEASKLLEELSDQDMVLQHLGWIVDVDQEVAVRVLTSEKRAHQLSPEEVISAIDPKKVEILQRYLRWLIEDQDTDETLFHTLYALSLAKSVMESVEMGSSYQTPLAGKFEEANTSNVENGINFQSSIRERLQQFLQSSDLYDPEEVLDLIEGSELWLEKAILYRKLGQETLVLQILALKLEDSEAAEQYCAEIGRPDAYMQLLDMYLDPQDGKEPMFKAAVRLLHNHGESLDPLQVLETLSPDMPLQLASDTILRMLKARLHHRRQGQIVRNLSRAISIDTKLARLEERSRNVQINDESLCDSCHTRLGTKLFAMYPDDSIVCYKCFRRLGDSTSVTGRNFKREIIIKPGWLVSR
ncbi:vacuolar sorting protein 3-like isoform X1 [Telopea speciosissima]|uniref:vacuolar sorting protein 3-like isoform X1 n=1 Tax=Telopea speciosissima TaxID=54955 RepID=UPI001CC76DBE|nr:vacuolar sorting protein 3-like isoform X1 [Telopea speciosissima]